MLLRICFLFVFTTLQQCMGLYAYGMDLLPSDINEVFQTPTKFAQDTTYQRYHRFLKTATLSQSGQVLETWISLGDFFNQHSRSDSAFYYFQKARELCIQENWAKELADVHLRIGLVFYNIDAYEDALIHGKKAAEYYLGTNRKDKIIAAYSLLCDTYNYMGSGDLAIQYCMQALKLMEQTGSDEKKVDILNAVGSIYLELGTFDKSDAYFKEALELAEQRADSVETANSLSNLGDLAFKTNQLDQARYYFQKTYEIDSLLNDRWGLAYSYYNIGRLLAKEVNYKEAKSKLNQALTLARQNENYELQAKVLDEIGNVYFHEQDYNQAILYLKNSLSVAQRINSNPLLKNIYNSLAKFYDRTGDYSNALIYFKLYMISSEKQFSIASTRKIAETESIYNLEKKEKEIALLKQENEIELLKSNRRQLLNYGLLAGLLMVLIMIALLFNAFRVKIRANKLLKKQKDAINQQKEEIESQRDDIVKKNAALEERNKMILDSITYAKRIQLSLLPEPRLLKEAFEDSFIFFKPKDIVSGDFYWFTQLDGKYIAAIVDCTGHGVPGAFMTVMAASLLDQIVNDSNITAPDMILSLLDHKIQHNLHHADSDISGTDGVDIAICVINPLTLNVAYSGAKIPLYYSKNGILNQIEPSRFSAGTNFVERKEFVSHTIKLKKGDMIYLASDGFQDQFGGAKDQKYMKSRFRDLLQKISSQPVQEQYDQVGRTFYHWKKNNAQTDDILVMGVRI